MRRILLKFFIVWSQFKALYLCLESKFDTPAAVTDYQTTLKVRLVLFKKINFLDRETNPFALVAFVVVVVVVVLDRESQLGPIYRRAPKKHY